MKSKHAIFSFLFLLGGVCLISLHLGTYSIQPLEIWHLLFHQEGNPQAQLILYDFRLPRLLIAAFIGGALAIAGHILQIVVKNPIADVGLLGINAGASFGSVLYFLLLDLYLTEFSGQQFFSLIIFGMAGALSAIILNFLLSFRNRFFHITTFLLNGIGISMGFSALTTFLSLKIKPDDFEQVNRWLEGTISRASWGIISKIIPVVLTCLALLVLWSKKLNMLRFSEEHLLNIGFPLQKWRLFFLFLAATLVSTTVFVAGNVAFVSLIVPHFTKIFIETRSRLLVPFIFINGMICVVIADIIAKNLFAPNEIPLNAVMGGIGIPYLLFLFMTRRKAINATGIDPGGR